VIAAMSQAVTTRLVAGVGRGLDGLRVLEFCDHYAAGSTGGSERVARQVNVRLTSMGARVTVLSAVHSEPFADDGIRVVPFPAVDLSRALSVQLSVAPTYHRAAATVAREWRPDVLYTHSLHFHGSIVAARLSRALGLPLVTVAHVGDVSALAPQARVLADVHEQTIGRFILRRSHTVVAVSQSVARHCARRGADPRAIVVAPNGVDHDRFAPAPEPGGPATVLFVGRLIDNKGPGVLLHAARILRRDGLAVRVLFAGDGPRRGELEREAQRHDDLATFLGRRDDVPELLAQAHVVARPSLTEGMPLAVLEAMAAGRCVVVSDIAAHREIVDCGSTGLLHRTGDARDLAEKLRLVLTSPALRSRLATASYESSLAFTWDATALRHASALAEAASVGRPARVLDAPHEELAS
jgi:glycosyltransferase involved in cell wall biosynthesis